MKKFYNLGRVIQLDKDSNTYKVGSLSHQYELNYFEYLYWKNIKKYENHEEYISLLKEKLINKNRRIDFDVEEVHQKLIDLNLISEINLSLDDSLLTKLYIKSLFNDFYLENNNYYVNIDNQKYRLNYSFVTTMTTHPFTIKELTYIHKGLKNTSLEESFDFVLKEIKDALVNNLITIEYFDKESLKKEIPLIDFNKINFKNKNEEKKKMFKFVKEEKLEEKAETFYYIGGVSIYKDRKVEKELVYLNGEFKTTNELEYILSDGMKSKSIKKDSLIKILEASFQLNGNVLQGTLNKIVDKGLLVPVINTPDLMKNKSLFLDYGILPKGEVIENKMIHLSDGQNKKLNNNELILYMNSYPELSVFETAILIQKEKNISMDKFIYEYFDTLNTLLSKEVITLVKIKKN